MKTKTDESSVKYLKGTDGQPSLRTNRQTDSDMSLFILKFDLAKQCVSFYNTFYY